jgi:hypothetical protein
MSPQASCASEALVGAASTVSIGEHMVVPPISELRIDEFVFFSLPIVEPRVGEAAFIFWSYLTLTEVEGKDASTAAVLLDSSLSIIDAICSQSSGSFSIS